MESSEPTDIKAIDPVSKSPYKVTMKDNEQIQLDIQKRGFDVVCKVKKVDKGSKQQFNNSHNV